VRALSGEFPGVVETSDNLGVVSLQDGRYEAVFMVRSLLARSFGALADEIVALAEQHGARADKVGTYPAWTPDRTSPLLARFQDIYAREFGAAAAIEVIHAGLECGLLSASQPHLEMISFGPDIRGAHAPGERVDVASVGRCWQLLRAVLRDLATPPSAK
jgi:dipeptidase D